MSVRTERYRKINKRVEPGFTLVEILVVLVIVGVLIAVAFLSFGILGDERGLEREARRMATLIEMVTDEATIQGRDYGLEIMQGGYRFVEHDQLIDQWFEVQGDDFMRPRELAEGTEFELFIEEHNVLLETDAKETEKDEEDSQRDVTEDYLPHVLILSSGDVTPFELRLLRNADRAEITLSMTIAGELEIQSEDQDLL